MISRILLIIQCLLNLAKIKFVYKHFKDYMIRFFLRPIFDLPHHFFPLQTTLSTPTWATTVRSLPREYVYNETQPSYDPHQIFQRFYKEHEIKHQSQKNFFKKHYPQKLEEKFDPFKILQINKDASIQDVKEAYRNLAIKYHPKNNSSPEASAKFAEVSKAYSIITESKKKNNYEDYGFNSFFKDFEKEIQGAFGKNIQDKQYKQKKQKDGEKKDNYGSLYSQSSHYETMNGQQAKYVIEKIYKKDGKFVTVRREERLKDDGKVQITELIDNGKEIKKKTYIHQNDVKKIN